MAKRKKLIFFTNSDPAIVPERIEQAYHFANIAAGVVDGSFSGRGDCIDGFGGEFDGGWVE